MAATKKTAEVKTEEVKTEEVKEVKAPAKKAPAKKTTAKKTTTKKAVKAEEKKEEAKPLTKAEERAAKKAAKKAEKEKALESAKPEVTSARASARNVRVTPRKARLVIDLVRGKDVKEALGILANVNKSAVTPVTKVIKSAVANATNNFGMDENSLYIAEIYANDGIRMKRYLPRAKGSASGLVKRSTTLVCVVKMR